MSESRGKKDKLNGKSLPGSFSPRLKAAFVTAYGGDMLDDPHVKHVTNKWIADSDSNVSCIDAMGGRNWARICNPFALPSCLVHTVDALCKASIDQCDLPRDYAMIYTRDTGCFFELCKNGVDCLCCLPMTITQIVNGTLGTLCNCCLLDPMSYGVNICFCTSCSCDKALPVSPPPESMEINQSIGRDKTSANLYFDKELKYVRKREPYLIRDLCFLGKTNHPSVYRIESPPLVSPPEKKVIKPKMLHEKKPSLVRSASMHDLGYKKRIFSSLPSSLISNSNSEAALSQDEKEGEKERLERVYAYHHVRKNSEGANLLGTSTLFSSASSSRAQHPFAVPEKKI